MTTGWDQAATARVARCAGRDGSSIMRPVVRSCDLSILEGSIVPPGPGTDGQASAERSERSPGLAADPATTARSPLPCGNGLFHDPAPSPSVSPVGGVSQIGDPVR